MSVRKVVGLLVPAVNTVVEGELHRLAPAELELVTARLPSEGGDLSDEGVDGTLDQLAAGVHRALDHLPRPALDGVAYCCTAGSFFRDPGWETRLAEELGELAGVPTVTTSGAIVDGLRRVGAVRVAVATPYVASVNERLVGFLTARGFEVVREIGLASGDAYANARLEPEAVADLVARADHPDADAVAVPCTNLRALDVVEAMEQRLGKPIVTANQATSWAVLRMAGVRPGRAVGRLMASLNPVGGGSPV